MRVLALDLGSKTIGCAVSDAESVIATPLRTLPRRGGKADREAVAEVVQEVGAEALVLGLPTELSGREGPAALAARRFGEALSKALGIGVQYWDERFSTVAAERALLEADMSRKRRRQVVDHVAAALILQSFLDAQRNSEDPS